MPEKKGYIPESAEMEESAGGRPGKDAATILVADDEPVNLQIMINILSGEGYRVVTCHDRAGGNGKGGGQRNV